MKSILIIAGLFLNSFAFAQQKITGKWKPVYFTMDKIITADIKADTVFLSDSLDVIVKDDKDPAASKELMQFMAELMLKKMKDTEQEFLPSGGYIETNKRKNTNKKGTYIFNASSNLLTIQNGDKADKFIVSFKNDHLILTGELENRKGKKGELIIEYEKL
ncbi:hypothetical protein [Ferruginibacter sp.]